MNRSLPTLLAASAITLTSLAAAAPAAQLPGPVVGQPAPDFTLTTLDGKTVQLADYRGKTLVINVWGSWCPPCRLETADLNAEAKADASRGVKIVEFQVVPTSRTTSPVNVHVDASEGSGRVATANALVGV